MSKYDKFFALAKEAALEQVELFISESHSLQISLFHGEVDEYKDNNGYSIMARGILNGKCGSANADVWNKEKAAWLVNEIVNNAKVIENDDPIFIFKGFVEDLRDKYRFVHGPKEMVSAVEGKAESVYTGEGEREFEALCLTENTSGLSEQIAVEVPSLYQLSLLILRAGEN